MGKVQLTARDFTPFSYVGSDLYRVLSRMAEVSKLIGLVTLLVAIPLLWLAWVVAKMLSQLLLMNERRLIGLALIRGVPIQAISQTLLAALIIGGLAGGLLGLVAGLGLPVLGYSLAGHPVPPWSVFMRGIAFFPVFIVLGLAVALFAGWGMIKRIRKMTPKEAMARVSGSEMEEVSERLSPGYLVVSAGALILGGYKVCVWLAGDSLILSALQDKLSESQVQTVLLAENLLNFIAIPLFLAGIIGLLRWRLTWFQYLLNALTAPLVGKLRWFVAEHMALSRARIASTLFLTSLAMSLALLPQVAADTFYNRVLRGVDLSLGADIQLEYSLSDLAGGKDDAAPVPEYRALTDASLDRVEAALKADSRTSSVTRIQQFIMPGVYLPIQSSLMLNLIEDPAAYQQTVYYEDGLGLTRPFSDIVSRLSDDYLTASQGFLKVRKVPLQSDIIFGYTGDYVPVTGQFNEVIAFLPGQPSAGVLQREGYATAEVDYLNYVMSSDARVFASTDRFDRAPLSSLKVIPSRAVFLVNTNGELNADDVDQLAASMPIKPQNIRWQNAERQNVGKDMFISLALGNMQVFMIGGLILAITGVFVVGLANFIAERRTFSLLRLRGLPLPTLLRVSLAMFLVPVIVGIGLGILLGIVSGYGISQAVWELPRIYGLAGFLDNQLALSATSWGIVATFTLILSIIAIGFGIWPFRNTAREAIKDG
jgi:ABC-type antimicrobial peptide transport system permease subunit